MGDAVVGFLLDNLTRLLTREADLILGVEDEVQSLQYELRLTHCHLKSLEGQRNEQDILREYASQIRGLVHQAEDVIDSYVANVVQQRGEGIIEIFKLKFRKFRSRHQVAETITGIKRRFEEIYNNRDKFGIQNAQARELAMEDDISKSQHWLIRFERADVVGFDAEAEMITKKLIRGDVDKQIIPIVGMSGIGKTTLAGKVYHEPAIISHFGFRAWLCVSHVRTVRELLETIMKCVSEVDDTDIKKMSKDQLHLNMRKYLRSTRYLIVLDDVWQTKSWEDLDRFFPNNTFGSRIILTTQRMEVALSVNSSPHELQFLTKEKSWDLLSHKVFRGGGECPSDLKDLGKEIAEKCGGLPLAIVVIAGVLRRKKKTTQWWSRVSSSVSSIFNDERTKQCREIFELSYSNLPHHLRPCFLYFGNFPESSEIPTCQLTTLWIAEGFIPKTERMSLEEVAEEYLEDLIDRNLIQLARKKFEGGVKSCNIHDLLRVFCISKSSEEKFLEVHGAHNDSSSNSSPGRISRRLAIHSDVPRHISSQQYSTSNLRSLLCFSKDEEERVSSKHLKLLNKGYLLLRVLDLWGVVVDEIPSGIEKLICLRYLRLKSDTAKTLPSSIYNLWNLQTLEVKAPSIDRPQINVWKMPQLRHFYFNGEAVLREPSKKIRKERNDCLLRNLQTLSSISPDSCTDSVLSEVPNLVKLGVYGDLEKHKDLVFKNLSRLMLLRKLKLKRDRQYERLFMLPNRVEFPPTLVKLTLSQTELAEDPMKQLGQLPNLQVLKLKDSAYVGKDLNCTNGGFPRLGFLKLVNLGITNWCVSIESMPRLRSVFINRCERLVGLPSSLQHKSALQEMQLWWPNVSVANCAREIEIYKGKENIKLLIYHAEDTDGMD